MATRNRKEPTENTSKELLMFVSQQERNVIRTKLLECLAKEQISAVRNKIGDAVAEVARQCSDAGRSKDIIW